MIEPQSPHTKCIPAAKFCRRRRRIPYRDAAQPLRVARQRIEHRAIVAAMRAALHQHAAIVAQAHVRRIVRRRIAYQHAERGALHAAVGADLLHHRARQIDRHRETVARADPRRAGDRAVDADDFAADVHERSTRVARIDGGVGLNEVLDAALVAVGEVQRAALCADDSLRHGEREVLAERVADREHPFAHARRITVAERCRRQSGRVDLQHGDVGRRIGADDARRELASIQQPHGHLRGAVDDVIVREDVAVLRHDEAGARCDLMPGISKNRCISGGSPGNCGLARPRFATVRGGCLAVM